ncbi:MAG: hypothetical protein R3E08_02350 [Thiotrichaceae bacterium]
MPHTEDGRPVDIVLNPLGVPITDEHWTGVRTHFAGRVI